MAEPNDHSINASETAPLLQEQTEELTQAPPENGAGKYYQ